MSASKHRNGHFFEDFRVGQRFVHGTPRTLTEADQSLYIALTGSRSCLNSAQTTANALGFAERPLEDMLVFNTAFGKTVPDLSLNAVANLGYAQLRFLAPVFSGDTLSVSSVVIGLKPNSNGKSGVVYVFSRCVNQRNETVLSWNRWVMVHRREPAGASEAAIVPTLPAHVTPEDMVISAYKGDVARVSEFTACNDFFEDYAVGDRVDHPAAMTLNDSDHSLATRLYQNTARAHFDAMLMRDSAMGQRLVYGGHIMSICKALAYDGFENALSILAIHGGRHAAPSFAGDTICCATRVTGKTSFGDAPVGGLRLRMVGAKNLPGAQHIQFDDEGRPVGDHIVLDLDLTIAIPKRSTGNTP